MPLFPSESLLPSHDLFPSEDDIPSITITRTPGFAGTTTIQPYMMLDYVMSRNSSNIVHHVIGTTIPAVIAGGLSPREGTLSFLCRDFNEAWALEAFHLTAGTFTLEHSGDVRLNLNYVLADGGRLTVELDSQTRELWIVTIDVVGLY